MSDLRQFGEFRLDAEKRVLWHGGEPVNLALKQIELLCVLTENGGEVVTKAELLDKVWQDSFVEESNLSRHIYVLRKTFKDLGQGEDLIKTVPRRGYRFTGEVRAISNGELVVEKHTRTRTRIEFQNEIAAKPFFRQRLVVYATFAITLATVGAFFGYQYLRPEQSAEIKSLIVLPFKVAGNGDVYPHAGAGLADILTTRLSNIHNIKIRPASSAAGLEDQDPITTGEKMQVDAVLDGSIYYFNERVRVTARLIRVSDSSVVWAGEFEKLKKDELQLQNDLALQIVPALAINLSGGERAALTKQYTLNADAYDLYLRGRYEWNKRNVPGMIEAQRLFRNAIAADPSFSLAYVGLADTLLTHQPSRLEASVMIAKALEADPNLAEAHASRGFFLMFLEWQWDEAEAAFKRSLELNPNYATAHHWYATLLAIKGETGAAKAEMHRALEIDPFSYNFLADLGQLHYFSGDYTEAEKYCLKALEIYPDFTFGHEYLHYVYLKTGEFEKAVAEIKKADAINDVSTQTTSKKSETLVRESTAFQKSGINGYLEERYAGSPYEAYSFYLYAKKHAFLGEKEKALEYLEKSVDARQFLAAFLKADPIFEPLHSEPRYQEILRKMGLA